MARIRTIKPDFWTDDKVVECSMQARLLFIALWNFSDDAGRQEDSPRQIKMKVFPGDDFTAAQIDGMLQELSENGLIIRYSIDGKDFIQVKGWHHQVISKPQASKIPRHDAGHSGNVPLPVHDGRKERKEGKERNPESPITESVSATVADDGGDLVEQDQPKPDQHQSDETKILIAVWRAQGVAEDRIQTWLASASGKGRSKAAAWAKLGPSADAVIAKIAEILDAADEGGRKITDAWAYLDAALTKWVAEQKPQDAPIAGPPWDQRVAGYFAKGMWLGSWGPSPDEPGCDAPAEIIAKHRPANSGGRAA